MSLTEGSGETEFYKLALTGKKHKVVVDLQRLEATLIYFNYRAEMVHSNIGKYYLSYCDYLILSENNFQNVKI